LCEYKDPESSDKKEPAFEETLVGIRLNTNNTLDERTPPQKHINFATITDNNQAIAFGYSTSSSQKNPTSGDATVPKLSKRKMDDSFTPEKAVEKNTDSTNPADFLSTVGVSNTKGGQYYAPYKEPLIVNSTDFVVSSVGTDYIHNNPTVEQKLQQERQKVLNANLPAKVYK